MDPTTFPEEISYMRLDRAMEPAVHLNNTLGAIFVGAFVGSVLYGILCLQCYIFFSVFTKDMKFLKISVATIWLLNSVHFAMIVYSMWQTLIVNFGTLQSKIPLGIGIATVVTVTLDSLVRGWFTYRVWILSKNRLILAILIVLGILVTMSGLWLAAEIFISSSLEEFDSLTWLLDFSLGLTVASDAFTALTLCFFLHRQKNPLNTQTNSMINFLMVYAINTGLFTAVVTIACMITHGVMLHNYVFIALYSTLGPLYANALLGSLNARDWFRKDQRDAVTIPLHSFNAMPPQTASHSTPSVGGNAVQVGNCKLEYREEARFDGAV